MSKATNRGHRRKKLAAHLKSVPHKAHLNNGVMFVLGFAIIGVVLLIHSFAATSVASFEPENGTVSGNASTATDSNASGGRYVKFNAPIISNPKTFTARFDTASDFYDNFDMGLSGYFPTVDPNAKTSWIGDHDLACNNDPTSRTVHLGADRAHMNEMFYWCNPPGDPDGGHVHTSFAAAGTVAIWFAPKQYFTNVKKVCWDQSMTFLGGREQVEVILVGKSDAEKATADAGFLDLGFSPPPYQVLGGPSTGLIPTDATMGLEVLWGYTNIWQGTDKSSSAIQSSFYVETRTRYTQCVTDNGNGTMTWTQNRDGGTVASANVNGSFPGGDVKVVFEDLQHNAFKADTYDPTQNTVHWDNIQIETK